MSLPGEKSFRLLGYWLGGFLTDTGYDDNFPELADIGPVSHTMSRAFPLHEYMHDTFLEAIGRGEVQRNDHPVLAPAQHDAVLRVGRQAALLAGTKNPENSTALTKEHVDSLVERSRTTAQFYTNRFIDFMQNNAAGLIPEYYSNSQEDMYPDDVADFGGWVL